MSLSSVITDKKWTKIYSIPTTIAKNKINPVEKENIMSVFKENDKSGKKTIKQKDISAKKLLTIKFYGRQRRRR